MLREIKFRAKSMFPIEDMENIGIEHENGCVTGNLIANGDVPYIVGDIADASDEYITHEFWVMVNPETVCQYTGLQDKHGKEIYEGDNYHQGDPNITYTVVWNDTGLIGKQNSSSSYAGLEHWKDRTVIVDNEFEDKHLLEGDSNE